MDHARDGNWLVTAHLDRYRVIAETLARHGLGALLGRVGLGSEGSSGPTGDPAHPQAHLDPHASMAVHLRRALEELGPTFVKLGQLLSTRSELLPPIYVAELARLQDSLTPVPAELVRAVLEAELGGPVEDTFSHFEDVPLATASIGQAHAAALLDGTEVVVKIRRPGAVEQVAVDLEIMHNLAVRADRYWEEASDYDVVGLTDEFARSLRAELNYLTEARNTERFAENFRDSPDVEIPTVHWAASTSRVLTMQRLRGRKVSDLEGLDADGIDRPALAARATGIIAQMIFDDGFFHADPHPGNLFIEPQGRIGLIDFGMVGELDAELRDRLGTLLLALIRKDPHRIAIAIERMSSGVGDVDVRRLSRDLQPIVALYDGQTLGEVKIGRLVSELLAVLRHHHLQLPHPISLVLRMVLMTEGMGVALDPHFSLGATLGPYAQRLIANRYSPAAIAQQLTSAGSDALEILGQLPTQLRQLQKVLDEGGPELHLRTAELEPMLDRFDTVSKRVVFGALTAALVHGVLRLPLDQTRQRRAAVVRGVTVGAGAALAAYYGWAAGRGRARRPL
jgi:ubiquinone biosynthesis protein